MLLRRITTHVSDQNWFAVALDFFIVVVGILIAFQITNWTADRNDREREQHYLYRLHTEIAEMVDDNQATVEYGENALSRLEELGRYFVDDDDSVPLTGAHCIALIQSHIYVTSIVTPATMTELLSTGRILLITNDDVKSNIITFTETIHAAEQFRADVQSDRIVLASRYPDLFTPGLRWNTTECAFEDMKAHPSFTTHFIDGLFRKRAFTRSVSLRLQDLRIELHAELDRELGLSH